jgi:hypothetical protein
MEEAPILRPMAEQRNDDELGAAMQIFERSGDYVKEIETSGAWTDPAPTGPTDERKRHKLRERKRRQAERDASKWRRCYATPNDPDARALVARVVKGITDPNLREAIRTALDDPQTAPIGRHVLRIAAIPLLSAGWSGKNR